MARSCGTEGSLESAESHLRGGAGANPTHDERTERRDARAAAEERNLRRWAFEQYEDPNTVKIPRSTPLGRGAEHEVYFDPKRNRAVKVTRKSTPAGYGFGISLNHDGCGATAGEYLDRLRLYNLIFNDDVHLEGVLAIAGSTRIVTSQPFITGEAGSPEQIDYYMAAKGFDRLTEGAYYLADSGVLVHDLYPRNIVATPAGNLHAIDPAIMRATPELAEFIRRTRQP